MSALSSIIGVTRSAGRSLVLPERSIATTAALEHIIKLTRLRVVDNSDLGKQAMLEGKPPKVIHVYNKRGVGHIGDKVLVAIKGLKKKAIIVGCKGQWVKSHVPRFDTNNCVLVNDDMSPLGNRILVPIPHSLRNRGDYAKLIAIGTSFV
ncbi:unnamed protein product [Notodromas monacha]|uniref:Large ribosomal subunit protein uL14m n=1 Tax=Notodromas monacha TaxID=399045 RepID=A0A7R9BLI4_9CRUS|nr:unnamed protein product [Notodromas monacha]CAG0916616.1 unnamed protein product [Notodromas monacha]